MRISIQIHKFYAVRLQACHRSLVPERRSPLCADELRAHVLMVFYFFIFLKKSFCAVELKFSYRNTGLAVISLSNLMVFQSSGLWRLILLHFARLTTFASQPLVIVIETFTCIPFYSSIIMRILYKGYVTCLNDNWAGCIQLGLGICISKLSV